MATRLDKVKQNIRAANLGCAIISDLTSISYIIDRKAGHVGERLFALAIPAEGRPTLFVNRLFPVQEGEDFDIAYHGDTDLATKDLAAFLPGGDIGFDRFLHSQFLIEILEARADVTPKIGSFVVDDARLIKDEAEQDAMRLASKINDAVFATIPSLVREGMTENELSALLSQQYKQLGDPTAPTAGGLICFGESAAEPHHSNSERKLKPGDVILIDAGQRSYGYNSDMTRTFFYKTISKEQEEVYQIVKQANELAEAAIKPGVKLKDIDAAARSHIASFGYGEQFTHRTGHNIGLSVHEEPSVSAVCEVPAQEGMTFSIEPGIYLPGQFGVRVEDLILVTKDGCEVLNAYSKEIQVIG